MGQTQRTIRYINARDSGGSSVVVCTLCRKLFFNSISCKDDWCSNRAIHSVWSSQGFSHFRLFHYHRLWCLPNALMDLCFGRPSASFSMLSDWRFRKQRVRNTNYPSLSIHSPVDREGNGNTSCVLPVKRQFPRATPLLCTSLCYAFIIGHTHNHISCNLSDLFVELPLSQALYCSNCC